MSERTSTSGSSRLRTAAVALAVLVLLIASAVMFSNAQSAERVAAEADAGITAEATLSTAAVARNRAVQSLVIASAAEIGSATPDQLAGALDATATALVVLDERVEQLGSLVTAQQGRRIASAATEFAAAVELMSGLVQSGDLAAADASVAAGLEPAYEKLTGLLVAERNGRLDQIEASRGESGRVANAARFLVAFIIPLAAILVFRRSARRRQHALLLREELERQRAVSRTKDEFIANLSHELRTPLTGIYGFAMTLLDAAEDDAFTAELAGIIAGESSELSRMVEDLLTAAAADHKGVAVTIEPTEVEPEVAEVVAPFRALGREPRVDVTAGAVACDRLRLRQVLRNLLSNAYKHGGDDVRLVARPEGDRYVFEVSDDGPGVPDHVEDRMFQRFVHEGDEPLLTGSVGLGLAIAHLLTTRMNGSIVYARRNGRTVFAVSLPRAEAPAPASRPDRTPPPAEARPEAALAPDPARARTLRAAVERVTGEGPASGPPPADPAGRGWQVTD